MELEKVSSATRRDRATIDDSRDDRVREQYTVVTAADVDPAKVARRWFVEDYGFGARYLRDMTIRWINLGRASGRGTGRSVAGEEINAPLFRVCAACGHQDTSTHKNNVTEHRPWCPNRRAAAETTRSVALSRTLRTEGLVLRLPTSVTLGDRYAVPSLAAALLLGLRERIGGDPDHLAVATIVDPTPDPSDTNEQALLLHDVVPGGTGYLAELAAPGIVWEILHRAWQIVRDCECRHEERLACHRCLLPFAQPYGEKWVSRATAERHLREILLSGDRSGSQEVPATMSWTCTEEDARSFDPESHLEQRFRAVLAERLEAVGASVAEQPTSAGNRWIIRVAGRVWTLEPQELALGSKPDFILRCEQPGIPEVVIFTDGWRFHASPTVNRLADDAQKREVLRLDDRIVLGVTWQDLELPAGSITAPLWYNESGRGAVVQAAGGALKPALVDLISRGPIDFLLHWLQQPDPDGLARVADWLPMLAVGPTTSTFALPEGRSLVQAAADLLDGKSFTPTAGGFSGAWAHRIDTLVLAARITDPATMTTEIVALLDDRDTGVGEEHAEAWREWLRLSNLLALRQSPTTISVHSLAATTAAPAPPTAPSAAAEEWSDIYEDATDNERLVIDIVWWAQAPEPVIGFETQDGVPLSISWPDRRVVLDLNLEAAELTELTESGWTVVPADTDTIRETFSTAKERA
ncbi:DUF1998 domain-containing protein [Georgenia sp. SUBG003]|uniref:DUF1998 domain-containing protein n=1 Tax=Georgenia sp. SUBG003 TaxID=1497974 RepID=UPI003AB302F4